MRKINFMECSLILFVLSGLIFGSMMNGLEHGVCGALLGGLLGAIGGFFCNILFLLIVAMVILVKLTINQGSERRER